MWSCSVEGNLLIPSGTTINILLCILFCSFLTQVSVICECLNFNAYLKTVNWENNKRHLEMQVKLEILISLATKKRVKSGGYVSVSKMWSWKDNEESQIWCKWLTLLLRISFWEDVIFMIVHCTCRIVIAQRTRRDERDTKKAKLQSAREERHDMTCRERRGAIKME